MKSLRLLFPGFLAGILVIFLVSCEDKVSTEKEYDRTNLQGTAFTQEARLILNDQQQEQSDRSHLNGTGTSNVEGLLNNTLSMSHVAFRDESNNIRVEEGEFRITGAKGDYIFGTYQGGARDQDPEKWASLSLLITEGGGIFSSASGTLTAHLVPTSNGGDQFDIHYQGVIRLPKVKPPVD